MLAPVVPPRPSLGRTLCDNNPLPTQHKQKDYPSEHTAQMRDMQSQRSERATSVEKMKGADAQVAEWVFSNTRGLAKSGSQSSAISSGSSVSRDSGVLAKEESRHLQHLELLERLVLVKHKLCIMIHCTDR